MSHQASDRDSRMRATAAIWGCAVAIFGICIPLVAITKSGVLLPLIVMLGASGGTAAACFAPDRRQREAISLIQNVRSLEERVMNLEAIYTSLPESSKSPSLRCR